MRTRLLAYVSSAALLFAEAVPPLHAQTPPPPPAAAAAGEAQGYSTEQLDALLAPIALYPDALLAQTLMAATFPLQVVDAARWLEVPANKALQGDDLTQALASKDWDPSVKSLVPFPQVLAMMNSQLDWLQQVGYAMTTQQAAVMDSVQRLRRPAQAAGSLQSTPQQVVRTEAQTITVEPANPAVVYVPSYNPTVVYGTWPYPAYPPVYVPPPPGYVVGTALVAGLAFGAGVAIAGGLWGWASPNWGHGNVSVNVNRYNTINVNRPPINNANWRAGGAGSIYRPGGGAVVRPPAGPVGAPGRPSGLPANAVGRPSVSVPGNAVRPPQAAARLGGAGQIAAGGGRPQAGTLPAGGRAAAGTPSARPNGGGLGGQQNRAAQGRTGSGAFSGMSEGRGAAQFATRGAQSRQMQAPAQRAPAQRAPAGGGGGRAGGGGGRAGGGRPGR